MADQLLPPGARDSISLHLSKNGVYWIAVQPGGTVRVLPADRRQRAAFVAPHPGTISGEVFEVHPYTTGSHHILVVPIPGPDTVRLTVWGDRIMEARSLVQRERQWGIGLTLTAAYVSGYRVHPDDPDPAAASGGAEIGLVAGSSGRISGVLGVGSDQRDAGDSYMFWVFLEPRVRVYRRLLGGRSLDVEATLRIAQGNSSTYTTQSELLPGVADPDMIAPGLLLAYHLDRREGSRGVRASLGIARGWLGNTPEGGDPQVTRLSMSLIWLP